MIETQSEIYCAHWRKVPFTKEHYCLDAGLASRQIMDYLSLRVLTCFLASETLVSNSAVCWVIIRTPRLHCPANGFIASLAFADLGLGLAFSLVMLFGRPNDVSYGPHEGMTYMSWFFVTASTTNLCCTVTDRYISVVYSLRYTNLMTNRRMALAILAAWGSALVFTICLALTKYVPELVQFVWISILYTSVAIISPSLWMIFVTVRMIHVSRKHARRLMDQATQLSFNRPQNSMTLTATARRNAKAKSSTVLVIAVVLCFIVCYVVDVYSTLTTNTTFLPFISSLLFVVNSALNPIAYSFLKSDIRTEVKRLFLSLKCS